MAAAAAGAGGVPDRAHMLRAIELSRTAGLKDRTGKCFGAVIVDPQGRVVGEGRNEVGTQC
jgi:tRNA(Arg) A34 adenosine deaminase TadA